MLCARTEDRLERIATEIRVVGGEAVAVVGNITDSSYCQQVADTTSKGLAASTVS